MQVAKTTHQHMHIKRALEDRGCELLIARDQISGWMELPSIMSLAAYLNQQACPTSAYGRISARIQQRDLLCLFTLMTDMQSIDQVRFTIGVSSPQEDSNVVVLIPSHNSEELRKLLATLEDLPGNWMETRGESLIAAWVELIAAIQTDLSAVAAGAS